MDYGIRSVNLLLALDYPGSAAPPGHGHRRRRLGQDEVDGVEGHQGRHQAGEEKFQKE